MHVYLEESPADLKQQLGVTNRPSQYMKVGFSNAALSVQMFLLNASKDR